MILSHHVATAAHLVTSLQHTLSGYLTQYRLALYLSLGAVVTSSIFFNWHWLTTTELLRLLTALPCMLMMFKCLNCATSRADSKDKSHEGMASP
jgi:hypothetical protein